MKYRSIGISAFCRVKGWRRFRRLHTCGRRSIRTRTRRCARARRASTPTRGCAPTSRPGARLRRPRCRRHRGARPRRPRTGAGMERPWRDAHHACDRRSPWAGGEPVPPAALRALGLGSATLTECGSCALLVAARRSGTAPPPLRRRAADRRAAGARAGTGGDRTRFGAAAALCATRTPGRGLERHRRARSRSASRTVSRRSIAVPGSRRRLDASSSGVADDGGARRDRRPRRDRPRPRRLTAPSATDRAERPSTLVSGRTSPILLEHLSTPWRPRLSRAVCFTDPSGARRIGALEGDTVRDAGPAGPQGFIPTVEGWRTLAAASGPGLRALRRAASRRRCVPGKLVCIGLNYRDHAEETGQEIPAAPVVFAKFTLGADRPGRGDRRALRRAAHRLRGRAGPRHRHPRAPRHAAPPRSLPIGGITAFNDVSGREAQFGPGRQFTRGKSYDTFAPIGPCVASVDGLDLGALGVRCTLSGEVMQDSSTANLIFGVQELIEFCSAAFTLEPGDVIATGTPPGVGDARTPPRYLQDGDVVEVEIEGVGVLRNPCVAEERPRMTLTLTAIRPARRRDPDARRRSTWSSGCSASSARAGGPCSRRASVRQAAFDAGERPTFRRRARAEFRVAPDAARPRAALGRDHRPRRAAHDDQRVQLGRELLHGRPRGLALADLRERRSAARRRCATSCCTRLEHTTPEGREYRLNDSHREDARPPPRLAPGRGARPATTASPSRRASSTSRCSRSTARGAQVERGVTPAFYLPKLENADEAALWNDVFVFVQEAVGIPRGTFRATVLIETITAAFEMDAILYALREHASGLNAGRWDYIFSVIKKFREDPAFVLPDRVPGHDDRAVHARLHRAARADVPPPRRARDRRHVGADPEPARPRGERDRAREGRRGQAPRGGRRLRRHLDRAPRPGRRGARGVRGRARRPPEPEGAAARGRRTSRASSCSTSRSRARRSATRACARTSTSASATCSPGSRARARRRSTG